MSLIARDGAASSFKPVPPGMHLARCYRVVDLGTQTSEWKGVSKQQHKIMVFFEVHGEDSDGKALVTSKGEPMTISKNYTLSLNPESRLRKDLAAWRSRDFTRQELDGFELKNILGSWAMLSVQETLGDNQKVYTNIVGINPVPAKIKQAGLPEGFNKTDIFDIDSPDMALFETFSDWLKGKIKESPEWQRYDYEANENRAGADKIARQKEGLTGMEDDLPF